MKSKSFIISLLFSLFVGLSVNAQYEAVGCDCVSSIESDTSESDNYLNPVYTVNSQYLKTIDWSYKNTAEWGKYIVLRAVGWTALGVGVASAATGWFVWLAENVSSGKTTAGPALTIGGATLAVASVPILISAYHFKREAKQMSLNFGVTQLSSPMVQNTVNYSPGISFSLTF